MSSFGDCVAVDFDCVGAILFVVGLGDGVGGEFAGLTCGHKTGTELEGEDAAADETAALDAHHFGDTFVAIELGSSPSR